LSGSEEWNYLGTQHVDASYSAFDRMWKVIASPFLYQGGHDEKLADEWYQKFFDVSIQKGERKRILSALLSNFNTRAIGAGLLNIDQRRVYLQSQYIDVIDSGACWADIEIHEVYENQMYIDEVNIS
jgi:hypothetical protein